MEIIFTDPNTKRQMTSIETLPPLPGIPRVEAIKVLSITLTNCLSINKHIDTQIAACGQSLYALKTLRAHGMNNNSLAAVFKSVALSKLQYATAAWIGFASAEDHRGLLAKEQKSGFLSTATANIRKTMRIIGSMPF